VKMPVAVFIGCGIGVVILFAIGLGPCVVVLGIPAAILAIFCWARHKESASNTRRVRRQKDDTKEWIDDALLGMYHRSGDMEGIEFPPDELGVNPEDL
jgi:hypothetical protein